MTVLAARSVEVRLGRARVLRGVDLEVAAGRMTGLIGPNGAGKTTLLRALAGLLPVTEGTVTFDGRSLDDVDRRAFTRAVAYLAQGAESHWPLSVERLVALGRLPHLSPWQSPGARDVAAIGRALDETDVRHLAKRPVTELSTGERARALLSRVLAGDPATLLADEPVAGLDPYHQLQIMELLRARAEGGAAVLVVLHDLALAARFCHHLVLLDRGEVIAEGSPEHVLTPANLSESYGIRAEYTELADGFLVTPVERIERPKDHGEA